MPIKQEPFVAYHEKKKHDTFTVKLNAEERALLDECKNTIEQAKDSTALKQLAWIGAKVLRQDATQMVITTLFKNKQRNDRTGVSVEFE
jgi:hypothetical protein